MLFETWQLDNYLSTFQYLLKRCSCKYECIQNKSCSKEIMLSNKTHIETNLTVLLSLFKSNSSHSNCDSSITVLSPRFPQERIMWRKINICASVFLLPPKISIKWAKTSRRLRSSFLSSSLHCSLYFAQRRCDAPTKPSLANATFSSNSTVILVGPACTAK